MAAGIFGSAYHLTHADDDFREGETAPLVRRNSRPHREAQRSYECKERCALTRDESAWKSGNTFRWFFHWGAWRSVRRRQ